jgi:hypothetical protein
VKVGVVGCIGQPFVGLVLFGHIASRGIPAPGGNFEFSVCVQGGAVLHCKPDRAHP